MGLQNTGSKLRSGYVEGYGTSPDMNCLSCCDHLLYVPLKFISKVDLWWSTGSLRVAKSYEEVLQFTDKSGLQEMDCVTNSQVSEQHAFLDVSSVSNSPQRCPLWLCVVSNKEEILVPSWPAHRGHRKFMRCVPSVEAAFEQSLT